MTANRILKTGIAASTILVAFAARADVVFNLELPVSALAGNADGPFFVDFSLVAGSPSLNDGNFAHIYNANAYDSTSTSIPNAFTGALSTGVATGDLGATSGVYLGVSGASTENADFNEQFDGSTADLKFTIDLGTRFSPGSPDVFTVQIYDASTALATDNPVDQISLLRVPIDVTLQTGGVSELQGDRSTTTGSDAANAPGITPIVTAPEPSSVLALLGGVGMLVGLRRKRA